MELGRITPRRKSGNEPFHTDGMILGFGLHQFWQWAASDLMSNAQRGVLAEFLVARAVGVDHGVRTEWDAFDICTPDGIKIEVKASGYLQSWKQSTMSKISFDIGPKRSWDAATNTWASAPSRPADVYVFALHAHQDQASVDPLDVSQWKFYVLRAPTLDEHCATQKTIGLAPLIRLSPRFAGFAELAKAISDEARSN